jgi:hypothetical protein
LSQCSYFCPLGIVTPWREDAFEFNSSLMTRAAGPGF